MRELRQRGYWPPPIWVPGERPSGKWIGRFGGLWIGAAALFFFLFLVLVDGLLLGNTLSITIGLLVGSFGSAVALLYVMAYRIGPRDTLTVPRLLLAATFGGLIAVTLGSTLDILVARATGSPAGQPGTVVLLLAGVTEEFAKIVAVVAVSWRLADRSVRNGLFLGGAVGFGFAAMEDLGYAVRVIDHPLAQLHLDGLQSALLLVPLRAAETPVLHPIFTALLAAAVFAAARNGRFRITGGVVLAYLGVAVAHGLFDGSGSLLLATGNSVLLLLVLVVIPGVIVGSGLVWLRVARRARFAFQLPVAWWLRPPTGEPLPPDPLPEEPPRPEESAPSPAHDLV